jgi:hypothetical protein
MKVLQLGIFPIYLPYDKAPVPFGDPIEGITCTSASPGVISEPGTYVPTNGDAVSLTYLTGGSMPTGLTYGQTYYVVSATQTAGLWTFSLSATKGGSAINTTGTGSSLVLHLLSGQVDGVTLPFKSGGTVVVENNTGGPLTLQGAFDTGQATPGNGYNPPAGPGAWGPIVTVAAGGAAEAVLNYDWIRVSTNATLVLQQN